MFEPTRDEARLFFFETWRKHRAGEPLAGLEQTVIGILLMHPEYHAMLGAPAREAWPETWHIIEPQIAQVMRDYRDGKIGRLEPSPAFRE